MRTEAAADRTEATAGGIRASRERQEAAIARFEAELKEHRDERQALKEAVMQLIDRLPPPGEHLPLI